jgi:hypothetical protein
VVRKWGNVKLHSQDTLSPAYHDSRFPRRTFLSQNWEEYALTTHCPEVQFLSDFEEAIANAVAPVGTRVEDTLCR